MNILKTIFTSFVSVAFATTAAFANINCNNPVYRYNHPQQCNKTKPEPKTNTKALTLLGGVTLIGIGAALASQISNSNGSSNEVTNQNVFPRSANINLNYSLTDKIVNRKIRAAYIGSATKGNDVSNITVEQIQNAEYYKKNIAQFDSINLALAQARGFTGKNSTIAVLDDFNSYHGYAVKDLIKYTAPDANIETYGLSSSAQTYKSFDAIANIIKSGQPANIYNGSWQLKSSANQNAATVLYNGNIPKTYAEAQNAMYEITSQNFVTQMINLAVDNDSIFVWAAGNEYQNESGALSALPLAFPELDGHFVNVVSFDTRTKKLAWYSNQCGVTQNYCITAPGSSLKTDSKESSIGGTSFAAPVVSGAIATIKEAFPYMTSTQITQLLFTTAQDLGEDGVDAVYGWGLLDMEAATKPVGTPQIVLSNETIQPFSESNVGGIAASAIKNAGLEIAFVDAFGRAFKTNLSDKINVVPYGRAFEILQEQNDNSITLFENFEFGFKQTKILESNGFMSAKTKNFTNFIGYKNEFNIGELTFYQNARFGLTSPKTEDNSIISGFSDIYTASVTMGAKWNDFDFKVAIPDTILQGAAYMDLPIGRANDGRIMYAFAKIDLQTTPSVEYTVKYKYLTAGYVSNSGYQDEVFIMAKTKFAF